MNVKFVKSATQPYEYPNQKRKEVAMVGRSNAGKSSFINALANQKRLAYVSHVPGKTQLLNFYDVGRYYRMVDMPGYGYAKLSKSKINEWKRVVESYITQRPNLSGLIMIMDIRRDWQEEEQMILNWADDHQCPVLLVLNKMDKLSISQQKQRMEVLQKMSEIDPIFKVSSLKKQGIEEVEDFFFKTWVK